MGPYGGDMKNAATTYTPSAPAGKDLPMTPTAPRSNWRYWDGARNIVLDAPCRCMNRGCPRPHAGPDWDD